MNILGLSYAFHDSAACLLKNGKTIALVEEERLNRIKKCVVNLDLPDLNFIPVFPSKSIEYVLRGSKTDLEDVDCVAVGFSPNLALMKTLRNVITNYTCLRRNYTVLGLMHFWLKLKRDVYVCLKKIFNGKPPKIYFVPHHLAHAASSVYSSGWEKSNFIAWDGVGELISMVAGFFDGDITKLGTVNYFSRNNINSIGFLYTSVTKHIGFKLGDEGKTMGLSSYGNPKYPLDLMDVKGIKFTSKEDCRKHLEKISKANSGITKKQKDLASSVQARTNIICGEIAENLAKKTGYHKLCLSGGVALNCNTNGFIMKSGGISDVFVPPGPGDQGTCLGAALYIHHKLTGAKPEFRFKHAYYGPEFSELSIAEFLEEANINYQTSKNPEKTCSELISEGKIVGWFQGRMEFGPRALGNRSILADPRSERIRDRVNKIKGRESWRPLAPSVLHQKGEEYFENYFLSPFMNVSFDVKKEKIKEIQGVTHVDGTSRLQSVEREQNRIFYDLIKNFEKKTGTPLVLNTSFNYAGEPIVCSPKDAIKTFYSTGLDCLFLGRYLISK